jgi:hypothetical protein
MKLSGMIGRVPWTNRLDFGEDPDVLWIQDPGYVLDAGSVCLIQDISKSYKRILMKRSGMIGHVPMTNRLDFGEDPDVCVDPGSF